MTPDISQWRSPDKYDYIEQLVSPELAWEWLRRNKSYQRDYADVLDAADDPQPLIQKAQQRWGLRFPHPAFPRCKTSRAILVARGGHGRRHTRRGACHPATRRRRTVH